MTLNIDQIVQQSTQTRAALMQERQLLERQIQEARRDQFFRQMEVFRQEHEQKKAQEKAKNRQRNITIGSLVGGAALGGLGALGAAGTAAGSGVGSVVSGLAGPVAAGSSTGLAGAVAPGLGTFAGGALGGIGFGGVGSALFPSSAPFNTGGGIRGFGGIANNTAAGNQGIPVDLFSLLNTNRGIGPLNNAAVLQQILGGGR